MDENMDITKLMSQVQQMMKTNQIPENVKELMNEFSNNSSNNHTNPNNHSNSTGSTVSNTSNFSTDSNNSNSSNTSSNNSFFELDMATMMKMKNIIESINSNKNDPRANLLLSLKPYLKNSRKDKVDEYIQLFKMGKVFEMMKPSDDKNSK